MNDKLEKKMKYNEKELYEKYFKKEQKIKGMLKTYEVAKENGASQKELGILKKEIRNEQKQLLESFNQYKEFKHRTSDKKKITQVKSNSKVAEKVDKVVSRQEEIKVIPTQNYKLHMKKTQGEKIITMAERKSKRKPQKITTLKRTKKADIIPISRGKTIARSKMKHKYQKQDREKEIVRKIRRVKNVLYRRYHEIKTKGKNTQKRTLKSIERMIRKKVLIFRSALKLNKSKNREKKKIVDAPKQTKRKNAFKMYKLIDNDGYREAYANKKVNEAMEQGPKEEEKELKVIGWR